MPGLAIFAPALKLPAYVCRNCGFWQRYFMTPPVCPLCLDAHHVLPLQGWSFYTLEEAQTAYPMHWEELPNGVLHFWNEPVEGIGSHSYLLSTSTGNVCFEGAAVYSDEALAEITRRGGVQFLSASHPHSYGALWQLQDFFEPELILHPADFSWSAALQVTWPFDEQIEITHGITLLRTGVHFPGHTVLHDAARSLLCCGDAMKFTLDPQNLRHAHSVSTHKAFVRGVPLTPAEAQRYLDVFSALEFTSTFTPFEQVTNFGTAETIRLFRRLAQSRPHPNFVPLTNL